MDRPYHRLRPAGKEGCGRRSMGAVDRLSRYKVMAWFLVVSAILALGAYMAMSVYGLKFIPAWPFFAR